MGFNRSLVLDNRVSFAAITVDISFVNKAQISKQKKQDFIYGLFFCRMKPIQAILFCSEPILIFQYQLTHPKKNNLTRVNRQFILIQLTCVLFLT